jgi:hypothetical protein
MSFSPIPRSFWVYFILVQAVLTGGWGLLLPSLQLAVQRITAEKSDQTSRVFMFAGPLAKMPLREGDLPCGPHFALDKDNLVKFMVDQSQPVKQQPLIVFSTLWAAQDIVKIIIKNDGAPELSYISDEAGNEGVVLEMTAEDKKAAPCLN